jgi:hypothetical protein
MEEVHIQGDGTRSIWFQCLPDDIHRSELLDSAGSIKRKNKMADLEAQLGPDSPVLAQFDEITPPQGPRYVLVHFDGTGVVDIRIRSHPSEPSLELDNWDTIEQAGAEFGELDATAELDDSYSKTTDPGLDQLMRHTTPGWNMIRAHGRGFRPRKPGGEILIDIWPIAGPFSQEHIKHQPASPAIPKVRPGADVHEQWSRITGCLRRAGAATIADRAQRHIDGIPDSVLTALADAGLDPQQSPDEWFSSLTFYPNDRWVGLIPGYRLLSIEPSLHARQQALDTRAGTRGDQPEQTNGPFETFLPEYIPLADSDTHLLVYDTRPGPQHGRVLELPMAGTEPQPTTWKSLVHFLGDLSFALENRTPFCGHTPDLRRNTLTWTT